MNDSLGGVLALGVVTAASSFGAAYLLAIGKRAVIAGTGTVPSVSAPVKEDKTLTPEEEAVAEEMKKAIAENQFTIYYQTKVNIITGNIIGLEALIRWIHPDKGMIPPMQFLPIAEKNGFICEIGKWVEEQVCSHLRKWTNAKLKILPIAINFSRTELYQPDFMSTLLTTMKKYNIKPEQLELEIAETTVASDFIFFNALLTHLSEQGFIIAIDDFGSEHENLQRLEIIPCDSIKFDRDFVKKLVSAQVTKSTVEQIMKLARAMGIDVVCEGVETQEQVDVLIDNSCNVAQGYFFSMPTKWEDATQYLQQ